jgi:hypothetical protein
MGGDKLRSKRFILNNNDSYNLNKNIKKWIKK